jgi:hypothetical protein
MKQLKTFVAAAAMLVATTTLATNGPEKIMPVVKQNFEKQFTAATNVTWQKTAEFYFADFTFNEKKVSAAYNFKGELVGTSKVINTSELPLAVTVALAENYVGYTKANIATEINFDGQTSYYVSIENDKHIVKLKFAANGDATVDSKTRK